MADLPDYYTQAQISEAEAASFKGGLDANKSPTPVSRQIYFGTDTGILYVCIVDGTWVNLNALYLLLAGGTMTGPIAMGANKITGLADPAAAQDAATRAYVLARVALRLALTGGTMSGNIVMGGNKATGLGAPAAQDDALRYNRLEIRNAEIAAAAAIAYSKLNLALMIRNADIKADAEIALSKLNLPDKDFSVPVSTEQTTGAVSSTGYKVSIDLISAGKYCHIEPFRVPDDFVSLTSAEILIYPVGTGTIDWTAAAAFGKKGEATNATVDTATEDGLAVTNLQLQGIDISGALDDIEAGDLVGIRFTLNAIDTTSNIHVIALHFKYNWGN